MCFYIIRLEKKIRFRFISMNCPALAAAPPLPATPQPRSPSHLQLVLQHGDLLGVFGPKLPPGGGEAYCHGERQLQVGHRHPADGHPAPRQSSQRGPETLVGVLEGGRRTREDCIEFYWNMG